MGSGYRHQPLGAAAVAARLRRLDTDLDAARRQTVNGTAHAAFLPAVVQETRTALPVQTGALFVVSETVAVPEGFTGLSLILTAALDGLRDAGAAAGTLTVQCFADTSTGDPVTRTATAAGTVGQATVSFATGLAGLSGEVAVGAYCYGSAAGWVADSGVARLSALILFTR